MKQWLQQFDGKGYAPHSILNQVVIHLKATKTTKGCMGMQEFSTIALMHIKKPQKFFKKKRKEMNCQNKCKGWQNKCKEISEKT